MAPIPISSYLPSPETYGGLTATQRGETVRSKSERRIADYFYQNNIRYVYEQDARNRWNTRRISRPDFYLPDYGIYVEYWGMLAAKDGNVRSRYERNMKWKMAQYHRNNTKFISIYPNNLGNLVGSSGQSSGRSRGTTFRRDELSNAVGYCLTCDSATGPEIPYLSSNYFRFPVVVIAFIPMFEHNDRERTQTYARWRN